MPSAEPSIKTAGFSLLETLVAVMVLSVSLVVILQLFSSGLKAGNLSENYTHALYYAQNKMEETLICNNFEEGDMHGTIDGDFSWSVNIRWIEPEIDDTNRVLDMFDISVRVTWKRGEGEKSVELNTIAIAKKKNTKKLMGELRFSFQ